MFLNIAVVCYKEDSLPLRYLAETLINIDPPHAKVPVDFVFLSQHGRKPGDLSICSSKSPVTLVDSRLSASVLSYGNGGACRPVITERCVLCFTRSDWP